MGAHFRIREVPYNAVVMPGQQRYHAAKVELAKPWIFDLENDPKELWDIAAMNSWLGEVLGPLLAAYEKSAAHFPNIRPGSNVCPWSSYSAPEAAADQPPYSV